MLHLLRRKPDLAESVLPKIKKHQIHKQRIQDKIAVDLHVQVSHMVKKILKIAAKRDVDVCADHTCGDNEKCEPQEVQCFAAPCDPVPTCVGK